MTKEKKDIKLSVPEGMEFNKSYSLDSTHSHYYYDYDRNKGARLSFDEKLDIEVKAISARIDDKLARISNKGINDETEDTVDDLIGYLLLLKMSM